MAEGSHDYINNWGFLSLKSENTSTKWDREIQHFSEGHFKRKSTERNSSFFRGLLTKHQPY